MSSIVSSLPEKLKTIKPYLTLADQLEQKNEKSIAYYLRVYAVQNGIQTDKVSVESKTFLLKMMDLIEQTKANSKNDDAIQSETVGQSCLESYALKIFDIADNEDRQSKFSKNLVKQFYSAGLLFDALSYFGEITEEELKAKKIYAKRKAMYLNKCFQTGERPRPGPLVDDEFGGEFGFPNSSNTSNNDADASNSPSAAASGYTSTSYSNRTSHYEQPSMPTVSASASAYPAATNETSDSSVLTIDQIQTAQTYCKYATNALQYDDVPTAIKNLEDCLKLLKTGQS